MTDDGDISRRYRELPREEPPRHLDDAILAAARRAANTRPAPLVVPSGRQRWYFPLAAAAVIVLAVAVTVHVERERPAEEMASATSATPPVAAQEAVPASPPAVEMRDVPKAETPKPKPRAERERRKAEAPASNDLRADLPAPTELQKAPEPSAAPPAPSPAAPAADVAGSFAYRSEATAKPAPEAADHSQAAAIAGRVLQTPKPESRAAAAPPQAAPMLSASAARAPEQWLQGIADLRGQGWHEEADRQLAEFRKRYPEYKISEAMLKRVERR